MPLDAYFAWTLINLRPGRGGPGRLFRLDAYQLRGLLAGSWTLTLWTPKKQIGVVLLGSNLHFISLSPAALYAAVNARKPFNFRVSELSVQLLSSTFVSQSSKFNF